MDKEQVKGKMDKAKGAIKDATGKATSATRSFSYPSLLVAI